MKPDTLCSFILNHCKHKSHGGKSFAFPTSFRMCCRNVTEIIFMIKYEVSASQEILHVKIIENPSEYFSYTLFVVVLINLSERIMPLLQAE